MLFQQTKQTELVGPSAAVDVDDFVAVDDDLEGQKSSSHQDVHRPYQHEDGDENDLSYFEEGAAGDRLKQGIEVVSWRSLQLALSVVVDVLELIYEVYPIKELADDTLGIVVGGSWHDTLSAVVTPFWHDDDDDGDDDADADDEGIVQGRWVWQNWIKIVCFHMLKRVVYAQPVYRDGKVAEVADIGRMYDQHPSCHDYYQYFDWEWYYHHDPT